jgi:hypothetical protein
MFLLLHFVGRSHSFGWTWHSEQYYATDKIASHKSTQSDNGYGMSYLNLTDPPQFNKVIDSRNISC